MLVSTGHLGQSVGHQSDAVGILEATKKVFHAFCTRRAHAPATATNVAETFDEELYKHMQKIFLAISVDSASNENESYLPWIARVGWEGGTRAGGIAGVGWRMGTTAREGERGAKEGAREGGMEGGMEGIGREKRKGGGGREGRMGWMYAEMKLKAGLAPQISGSRVPGRFDEPLRIASINDMVVARLLGGDEFATNFRFVLRDAAHSARRLLQRLWRADEVPPWMTTYIMPPSPATMTTVSSIRPITSARPTHTPITPTIP